MTLEEKVRTARNLLAQNRNDEAVDVLRSGHAPDHPDLFVLLALAYYQRGDTRGDVYAGQYFVKRAAESGRLGPEAAAIAAIGAFRKEEYAEASALLAGAIGEDAPASVKLFYGICLGHAGDFVRASEWIEKAGKQDPGNAFLKEAREKLEKVRSMIPGPGPLAAGDMDNTPVRTLTASADEEIPAPYDHKALSRLRGRGREAKDFDWLEKNIPCQKACPAGTDIPGYLNAIFLGDHDLAYRINLRDNVFPGVLGRVCSRPCEEACRHGWDGLGEPVAICSSKRAASDHKKTRFYRLEKKFPATGKKAAVVGAGVAGLASARELALLGHQVIVFEKHSRPGGMMNQGIPEFRLPREVITHEIEQVEACGVEIRCGIEIGGKIPLERLVSDYDAVILAAGTLKPNIPDFPGNRLEGILHGLDFLLGVNESGKRDIGKKTVVIGGGFTAMDCARTAWRLGAESVRVLYRRSVREMLITPGELEELEKEGIPMEFMASPVACLDDGRGRVRAVRFVRNELGEPDAGGRRRPVPVPGSEFEVEAGQVLLATGQFPDTRWIRGKLRDMLVGEDGWLKSSKDGATAHPKIFVCGDFALGATSLIRSIGHARQAARAVDRALTGEERILDGAVVEDAKSTGRIREMDFVPRQAMPAVETGRRELGLEVETGYSPESAVDETQRCYLCHYKYEIDHDRCIYCDWCIKAKPRPRCILKVKELVKDSAGRTVEFKIAHTSEEAKYIYINQEDCIRCHACVNACPVDCISLQKVSLSCVETVRKEI